MIVNGKSNAATYKGAETDIYNGSLKQVTATKKKILAVYQQTLANIEVNLQRLKEKQAAYSIARLEALQKKVLEEIKSLNATQKSIITSGYIKTFETAYYGNGYEYERYANSLNIGSSYELGYYSIDRNYIIGALNERVAGETFGERSTAHILQLRRELRQAVAVSMLQGDSAATAARNIQSGITGIRNAMSKSANAALTIARTELLKAYSIGHEIASNQAEVSGVDLFPSWNAALDGKTRPDHQSADGRKFILDGNADYVVTVGGVVFSSPRIPLYSVGGSIAKQVVNCRCRRNSNPFGFQPVTRMARKIDGSWETVNGDMNYSQWAKTLEGRKEIQQTILDRSLRAKELRIMKIPLKTGNPLTVDQRNTLAEIRKKIKGRSPVNVGTRTNIA